MTKTFQLLSILSVSFGFLYCDHGGNKYQFNTNCTTEEYYNTVQLKCMLCPNNTRSDSSNPFQCSCKNGYYMNFGDGKSSCEKCNSNQTTSSNGLFCVSCAESQNFNLLTNTCGNCPDKNTIVKEVYRNESISNSLECFKCSDTLMADKNQCIPCHISFYEASKGLCKCPKSSHTVINGICALKSNVASILERNSSHVVQFKSGEFVSKIFQDLYKISAYNCHFLKNITACQVFANLCVLLHYSYDNELSVCFYYRDTFGKKTSDIPSYVPLLYYNANSATKIIENPKFNAKFCLSSFITDECNMFLNLTFVKYSMNGSLISWQPINELFTHCSNFFPKDGLFLGTIFHSHCQLPLSLIREYKTEFFELFIHSFENNKMNINSIPILNMDVNIDGVKINALNMDKWQFTKRFFIVDSVAGRTPIKNNKSFLKIIRYAELMELVVQLRRDSVGGLIYHPYLRIYYNELSLIEHDNKSVVNISFKVKHVNNSENSLKILAITNGIACGFALILALLKAWSLSKRCGTVVMSISIIFRFLCLLCGYIANCLFFLVFFICSIWFLIFKNQDIFWIFLPDQTQEQVIKKYIISAFSLKIIHIFYIIYNQITVNLFLIDWEQPKLTTGGSSLRGPYNSTSSSIKRKQDDTKYISIWRTYFIANEWNELQTHRQVNVSFVLFIMLFYLKVLKYEDICHMTSLNNVNFEYVPYSFISRFSLSVFLFIMGSFVQCLFKVTIFERYIENKLQMFVDLCSMANISVLIFKHRLYGYYIHGRSVYGESDLNMQSLYDQLKREEEDLCQRRGLEPSSECQTFEVRMTQKFRRSYDAILEVFEGNDQKRTKNRKESSKRIKQCIEAHEQMKNFLTIFLQHGLKGLDYIVKDKYFLENALDLEFQEPKEQSLFFRDHCHTFDKVLVRGKESAFLIFELMTFTFVDLFTSDFIFASIMTYLVHRIIKTIRYRGGKRNVIDKTLIDERFLI